MASYNPTHTLNPSSGYDASQLSGKSIIITGGASGLGEAMTRAFAAAGAFVTIGDLNEQRSNALIDELGGARKAAFVSCNVTKWADQVKLFKTAIASSPSRSVDVVVANAGVGGPDDVFNDTADAEGEPVEPDLRILDTNLTGVMYTVKLALHYFARQPAGEKGARDRALIMTASLAGYLDLPGNLQYDASKFGVRGIMRGLRRSEGEKGVRVNIIAPW